MVAGLVLSEGCHCQLWSREQEQLVPAAFGAFPAGTAEAWLLRC